jgi:hypothetical protein
MVKDWVKTRKLKRELAQKRIEVSELQNRLRLEGVSDAEAAVPIVAAVREVERVKAEIGEMRTARLNLKAIRLGIDLPPTEWLYTRHVQQPGGSSRQVSTLTPYGESKLRRNIMIEQRTRREFWLKHIPPIIAALTGVLGTLIGLLAILRPTK